MQAFKSRTQRAFSLIELVISMLILSIVSVSIAYIFQQFAASYTTYKEIGYVYDRLDLATTRITRELINAASIVAMTSTDLRFVDGSGDTISYQLAGTLINRINYTDRTSATLINSVAALTFSYYNATGNTTNSTSDVRYINLNVSLSTSTGNVSYDTAIYKRKN